MSYDDEEENDNFDEDNDDDNDDYDDEDDDADEDDEDGDDDNELTLSTAACLELITSPRWTSTSPLAFT